jgi:hypothetical protein
MRTLATIVLFGLAITSFGQVRVDKSLVLSAADSTLRAVEGLAPATQDDALITLGDAQSGAYRWGQASGTGMAITLALDPPCTEYRSGLTVRFMPALPGYGAVTLNVDGLGARPIYRSDGLRVSTGQLQPGLVAEAIYADTAFFLQHRAEAGCPAGYLQAGGDLCIMQNDTLYMSVYNATRWCTDRGARLCKWDEYIQACIALQTQMSGLFNEWEWIDGTSDHTHTANQAGRWQCRSQRGWGAAETVNNYAEVRCCFRPK